MRIDEYEQRMIAAECLNWHGVSFNELPDGAIVYDSYGRKAVPMSYTVTPYGSDGGHAVITCDIYLINQHRYEKFNVGELSAPTK